MKKIANRFLWLCMKIVWGLLAGFLILCFYASHSQLLRQEIKKSVQQTFKEQFNCDWDGQVTSVNCFTLHLEFSDVSLFPSNRDDDWSLYAQSFFMSASWFHLLFHRTFLCQGHFEHAMVYEKQKEHKNYFITMLSNMFSGNASSGMSFDYISIKQGQFIAHDEQQDLQTSYDYNCQVSCEQDGIHIQLYFLSGSLAYKDRTIFEKLYGNVAIILPYDQDLQETYARVDCRLSIPALQDKGECFLVGNLYKTRGAFVVSNEDQSFIIEPLKIRLKQHATPWTCSVTMQSDVVQKLCMQQVFDSDLAGHVTLTCMGNFKDPSQGITTKIEVANLTYKNHTITDQAYLVASKNQENYQLKMFVDKQLMFDGLCKPAGEQFQFQITNVASLQPWLAPYWKIDAGKFSCSGWFDLQKYIMSAEYACTLHSLKLEEQATIQGSYKLDTQKFVCNGSVQDKKYDCMLHLQPLPHLAQLRYYSDTQTFIDLHEDETAVQTTTGSIGFNFIKDLLPERYKSSFTQPGAFDVAGSLQQGGYCAQMSAHNAHIRIPSLYNVVQDFKATTMFNFLTKSITCDHMLAELYEGKIRCDHAVMMFDDKAQTSFIHAPLFLDNVLMSLRKGIFGFVSGRLFLQQQLHQAPLLQGNLLVDQAQLTGNIFSQEFQEQLIGVSDGASFTDLHGNLDITVETKEPITVETSFLQAQVHADLHVGGSMNKPEVEGSIDVLSGELKFPYKSLFITHGQIVLMPKNATEPTFEFVAKGKIKRYHITMHATGTMLDQQIHFESSPYLTEEQIIALLLTGSQDSSLTLVMPAMFMQKLQDIIFGPAMSQSKLDRMFHRLLQSFKNIRIFPQFANQTGRGGVRGVVEVDATERLHGRIDSNLMQLEDTIFEADYQLTDDVTMRAIKDGPSTYGGEVEMRWKFS